MNLTRKDLFKKRFDEYYPMLCRIAYRYVQNKEECEDIVQETFVLIWQKKKDNLSDKEFVSYIVTAVKNNCLSFLRKQKIETIYMEDMSLSPLAIEANNERIEEDQDHSPEETLIKILSILPPKCREVFMMSKLQSMKYREIAKELDISEKTVENHISKAIRMLREYSRSGSLLLLFIVLVSILIIF